MSSAHSSCLEASSCVQHQIISGQSLEKRRALEDGINPIQLPHRKIRNRPRSLATTRLDMARVARLICVVLLGRSTCWVAALTVQNTPTRFSTAATASSSSLPPSTLSMLHNLPLQQRRKHLEITMSLADTSMFLSPGTLANTKSSHLEPAARASVTTTTRGRQPPLIKSLVQFTADLHLTPQDLIHSRRFRDRGILGFRVDHSMEQHPEPSSSSFSSSLRASSRSSSSIDSSASPWRHLGDERQKEEEEELNWTSLSSWSSKTKRLPSQYNVWKNNHLVGSLSTKRFPSASRSILQDETDQTWIPSSTQIDNMNVVQLKAALAERGLTRTGNKIDLQKRLSEWAVLQAQLPRPREPGLSVTNLYQTYGVSPLESFEPQKPRRKKETFGEKKDSEQEGPVFYTEENWPGIAAMEEEESMTANSLAEWSRTVDLEPLFQRREAIHREKQHGKPVTKRHEKRLQQRTRGKNSKGQASSLITKEEYISVLKKVFDDSSSVGYSNYEVKQIYAAAKEADQMGDRALSKRILTELKESTPNDLRVYRRLSRMEKEEGNVAGAKAILQEGLRLDPENSYLWHGLGQLAPSDEEAKNYYRKAIEYNPSLPMPYHALATLEHTQGRIADAMKTVKKGLQYCPSNHRLHHALGDLYRDAKMLAMAENCYKKALKNGPPVSNGFAYNALAFTAYEDGKPEQCRAWLRKTVSINEGRQANGWVSWAQMEEAEGNIDAARTICMAGIAKYERGLLKRAHAKTAKAPVPSLDPNADPSSTLSLIRNELMSQVPVYRSGDRFFNVYRTWARLEERHGTAESVEEVYRRAVAAFPTEWKLTIDWAQHYRNLQLYERAGKLFAMACSQSSGQHGDPYRVHAEYEMTRGNYEKAQKILFCGAVALSQASGAGMENRNGMVELYYVWAVCEWHLDNLSRAENLFDHALRLVTLGEEGSQTKSLILYAMAQLQYYQGEPLLAQHCIGLCLKENRMPGGNSRVWDLWAKAAEDLGHDRISAECSELADKARSQEESDQPQLMGLISPISVKGRANIQHMMRRDPWHYKIFGVTARQRSTSFYSVRLPINEEFEEYDE